MFGDGPRICYRVFMSKYAILLSGPVAKTPRLMQQLSNARVIAADAGMAHAAPLKLSPELWVGDFDSTHQSLAEQWRNVPRQTHPIAKDASDGELAISEGLRRGATSLILVGAMGGQLDHVLAHTGFLLALAKRGIDVMMTSGTEEAYGLVNGLEFADLKQGTRISVMPFSDLIGLSISGVKWPLTNQLIRLGSAHSLANEVSGQVKLSLISGSAIVVVYPNV
jgi:thiamine pyrophosphokinase